MKKQVSNRKLSVECPTPTDVWCEGTTKAGWAASGVQDTGEAGRT